MQVYELIIEDMTTLGHIGSSPTVVSRKLYSSLGTAQAHARSDYKSRENDLGAEIQWTKVSATRWTSGDLMYIMYSIKAKEVID